MSTPLFDVLAGLVVAEEAAVVATTIVGGDSKGILDGKGKLLAGSLPSGLEDQASSDAIELLDREMSRTLGYEEVEVFFEVIPPRPSVYVFGAVHIAQEMVAHGSLLGYRTVVIDPRSAFLTETRFPQADQLLVGWPADVVAPSTFDNRSFVVVLTHDRRFEDPLWPIVLRSPARYIGAMGSGKTTAKRRDRLMSEGFSAEEVDRIHGPIGLPIGSRTAGETALAILAEMTMARYRIDDPPHLHGTILRV